MAYYAINYTKDIDGRKVNMQGLPKRVLQQLRRLIGIAHERELNYHIGELAKKFEAWKDNRITCWDLNDSIHEFHDGISRNIYKTYRFTNDVVLLVARAVAHNFLQKEEVPEEAIAIIEDMINCLKLKE